MLYYHIGQVINEYKSWGNKFIDNLLRDIKMEFPATKGYSVRNFKYMDKIAVTFPDNVIVREVLEQLPWCQNIILLDKIKDRDFHLWYARKAIENACSRNVLVHQIESKLYERQVLLDKVSNFNHRLPVSRSELAQQTMKDPYIFDFITFKENIIERDIEEALAQNVTRLLLDLGKGFAFLGNQYHLNLGRADFCIDLLFYNANFAVAK